jgi:hypothetical protein
MHSQIGNNSKLKKLNRIFNEKPNITDLTEIIDALDIENYVQFKNKCRKYVV